MKDDTLGGILLERKLVTHAQLQRAADARGSGLLGDALVRLGIVPQSVVDDAILEQRRLQGEKAHASGQRVIRAAEGVIALAATIGHEIGRAS